MEQLTRGDVEFSYGLPLTVEKVCKVREMGVYPMNGVHPIYSKSVDTTPKNSKICNISSPKIFIRVTSYRVDGTQQDPSQNVLPYSVSFTAYTTYVDSYLILFHGWFKITTSGNM